MTRLRDLAPRQRAAAVIGGAALVALVGLGVLSATRTSPTESGTLYYTTFQNQGLYRVSFDFFGSRLRFGSHHVVTRLPGADGVAFEPNGDAAVGGQGTGDVFEVDPAKGTYRAVVSGCPLSDHISVDPSGASLFTSTIAGPLCQLPLDPLRPGVRRSVHGDDDVITTIVTDDAGRSFYTTGVITGVGDFGTIDLSTFTTTRTLSAIPAGHGMAFDPYTRTLFLFGGESIFQVDPKHPDQVLSSMTVPGLQFDQGTTDGQGHIFVASNFGQIVVVDLRSSGRLGSPSDKVSVVHLENDLDDVAPLVGPGSALRAGFAWAPPTAALLGLAVVASALVLFGGRLGLRRGRSLPAWDLRRRERERRGRGRRPR